MRNRVEKGGWRQVLGHPLAGEAGCLLAVVVVALLAASRLVGPSLVASADGELLLFRTFALDRALQQGILFPRVLPDLLYGYGYPLFNFYPPASTYFVEALHLLGLGFVGALKVAYGASFLLAALAMYAFARAVFGAAGQSREGAGHPAAGDGRERLAALVAAAGYVLAPYFLIDVYTRGALAEALAMALFPGMLLAVHRLVVREERLAAVALALLTALLVLTHSAIAVFFLPLAAGYGLVLAWSPQGHEWRRAVLPLFAALLCGLGMSAFFWLPAALERGWVSAQSIETGFYDVHQNFLDWSGLVQWALFYPSSDPLPIPPRLGPPQVVLGLGALLLLRGRRPLLRVGLAYWAIAAAIALALTTPASAFVWESVPLIAGLSFPWRLLGLVTLAAAPLAGSLVLSPRPMLALPAAAGLVAVMAIVALPGIAPQRLAVEEADVNLERYWRFEFETSMVGTTSASEYLPRALGAGSYALPRVPEDAYAARAPDLPSGSTVRLLDYGAQRMRLLVAGDRPASIIAHAVYFPGWQATLDGRPITPYPSTPLGLVTADVPAGEHDLTLRYGQSDAAATGSIVSLISVFAGALALIISLRKRIALQPARSGLVLIAGLAVAALALLPILRVEPARAPRRPEAATGKISEDVALLGWQPPSVRDGVLGFNLYWQARRPPVRNEVVVVTLRDGQGETRARWERHPQYGYSPTLRWVSGEIVPDEYALPLPAGLTAGEYAITVGLRDSAATLDVGTVRVEGGAPAHSVAQPSPEFPISLRAGDAIRLLGYDLAVGEEARWRGFARPGEVLTATLYWQATAVPERDYTVFLHLTDERGERRTQHDGQPQDGRRPTILWTPGEVVPDQHGLALPADLPPGRYQLILGMYARPAMERLKIFDAADKELGDHVVLATVEVH